MSSAATAAVSDLFRHKVLISACLMGQKARFDGQQKLVRNAFLKALSKADKLSIICPELAGGLPVPRPAAEINTNGAVITTDGNDVSPAFTTGALSTLQQYRSSGAVLAILKEKSPSCGSQQRYSGNFDGVLINAMGITAALLQQHDVPLFNEHQLDAAQHYYHSLKR